MADAAQLGRDVLPRLRLRRDLVSVAGQTVKSLFERPDVLDQPPDAGGEDRAERIHGHRQGVEGSAHGAHGDRGPVAALDRGLEVGRRLQQRNTRIRLGGVFGLRDQRVAHYATFLTSRRTFVKLSSKLDAKVAAWERQVS
ncbi:hypothetical protein AB0M71_35665 [Amycolatopsis sp. NPDC051114]|uniref:hypothetical protein n=1 Tax=Amycolatopsis sp. NPDC051114 TaxID=3155280 RepID=UPI003432A833